jgi:hypothetical protein
MTGQRIYFSALFIFAFANYQTAKAQSYTIESLEGGKVKINLSRIMRGRVLAVNCSKDTVFLDEYLGVKVVHILKEKFLQIIYDVRAGTGSSAKNTLVLSVSKNKINVSMLVNSYGGWFKPDRKNTQLIDDKGLFQLKLEITGDDPGNYKMVVGVHDERKSRSDPKANYTHDSKVTLNFDTSQHIFYTSYESVAKNFSLPDDGAEKLEKKYISGTFPVIKIRDTVYYFMKGEWCRIDDNDNSGANYLINEYHRNL